MARTVSTAERNAAKGNRWSFYRLLVTNPDGTWVNLGALSVNGTTPTDFQNTAQISNSIDANTPSFSASVRREIGNLSLAPMRSDSPLNARSDFTYAPLLDVGDRRYWKIEAITLPHGAYAGPGSLRPVKEGIVTTLDISGDGPNGQPGTITLTGRGMEGPLLKADMTVPVDYATDDILDVLQAMVDRWRGTGVVAVYPDASAPSDIINGWTQAVGSLFPAMTDVAALPGASLRYLYDAADVNRLTLSMPNRNPSAPDYVIGPDEYRAIPLNRIDLDVVANYGVLTYADATFGTTTITSPAPEPGTVDAVAGAATFSVSQAGRLVVGAIIVVDHVPYRLLTFDGTTGATLEGAPTFAGKQWVTSASITRYGLHTLAIDLSASTQITDDVRAGAFIDAIIADTEFPALEQEIETEGGWFYELGDYLQLEPNATHYDQPQFGGVTSYTQTFAGGKLVTRVGLSGKPKGRYRTWLALGAGAPRAKLLPEMESLTLAFEDDGVFGALDVVFVFGPRARSALLELDDDPAFGSPWYSLAFDPLVSGTETRQGFGFPDATYRNKRWYARVTPYSGAYSGGVTGIPGTPVTANAWAGFQVPTKPQFDALDATVAGILGDYIPIAEKGAASGVATLDAGGKVPQAQLPLVAITNTNVVASQAAMLALTAEEGDVAIRTDLSKSFILQATPASTLANWQELLSPIPSTGAEVGFSVQNGTSVITAGNSDYVRIPAASTIVGAELVADVAGSVTVEVWRATYAAFPTFTKLSASAPMTLASAQKATSALTGWTTALSAGDYVQFRITGAPATITRLSGVLTLTRP